MIGQRRTAKSSQNLKQILSELAVSPSSRRFSAKYTLRWRSILERRNRATFLLHCCTSTGFYFPVFSLRFLNISFPSPRQKALSQNEQYSKSINLWIDIKMHSKPKWAIFLIFVSNKWNIERVLWWNCYYGIVTTTEAIMISSQWSKWTTHFRLRHAKEKLKSLLLLK